MTELKGWIYEPEYETMPRDKLTALQEERLRKIVNYCYERSPVYRKKFKEAGITPDDIKGLDDLGKIPFTTKEDLRKNYPYGMLSASLEEVVEVHASSGTTGVPTLSAYTANDLEIWGRLVARTLAKADARKGDLIQNAYGYGLFTGGLGLHYGALKIGATVLPTSAGNSERQIALAKELGTKVICCTPTYAAYLGEFAKEKMGIDPVDDLKWKSGVFGAEPWSEELRARIQGLLGLVALDIYGLSEVIGPGVAMECVEQNGLHIYEDHFLPEIIDPATGEPVEEGEEGELVITTLTKEAMPLLRYRTGDLTTYTSEECSCGRRIGRIGRILGRTDDMLKIRGAKVWPKAIENALLKVDGISQNYRVIIDRPRYLDVLIIEVEPTKELYEEVGGDLSKLQYLEEEIVAKIRSAIDVTPQVRLVPVESLPRFMGKAKRVEDRRKKE